MISWLLDFLRIGHSFGIGTFVIPVSEIEGRKKEEEDGHIYSLPCL
jgi:hypothetical protein